ncbi:hypothetical protein Tcan_05638 [Toxocara canis]|uniref:Uncharacterized protein n=1 Tax=Toxocara canis TaxID=6265 RepID=A0A0B2VTI1_TOXCA|nr:hypothetical protein Tcan_05638 [Toxocara canis]
MPQARSQLVSSCLHVLRLPICLIAAAQHHMPTSGKHLTSTLERAALSAEVVNAARIECPLMQTLFIFMHKKNAKTQYYFTTICVAQHANYHNRQWYTRKPLEHEKRTISTFCLQSVPSVKTAQAVIRHGQIY